MAANELHNVVQYRNIMRFEIDKASQCEAVYITHHNV